MQADPAAPSDVGSAAASPRRSTPRRDRQHVDRAAVEKGVGPTPWTRVKDRVPLTQGSTVAKIEALAPPAFARLIRDHLLPASPEGPEREAWGQMWATLRRDKRLAHRAFDVLEHLLEMTSAAREAGELDESARQRAAKFTDSCEQAWQRLEIPTDEPLSWAGRPAEAFNRPAKPVIDRLVMAIADHRRTVLTASRPDAADRRLWAVLMEIGLDPDPRHAQGPIDRRPASPE